MIQILIIVLLLFLSPEIKSQTRHLLPSTKQLLDLSRSILMDQVGIVEKTNNNDGEVEKYWRLMGFKTPQPYCAAGQYWCFYEACRVNSIPFSSISLRKTALAYGQFSHAKTNGVKVPFVPEVDDLLYWRHNTKVTGHVERIIAIRRAGWVRTVGMNTASGNGGDQRDGGGVYIRNRNVRSPLGRMAVIGTIGWSVKQ